jgi:cytochrome c oxidase subunit 3
METTAHQFEDAEQQREAATLGMWIFLSTEILFFGGMFLGYTVYRGMYPIAWGEASKHLDILLGSLNTAVLLCSSLTMAMAVHEAQGGRPRKVIGFIAATMALGIVFLFIKFYEYYQKYKEGLVPGAHFVWHGHDPQHVSIFFLFYFIMTGMHAVHMIIGLGLMTVLAFLTKKRKFTSAYFNPIEMGGLYWHFVDIIWVFLFPLLYLVDRSG